MAPAMVMAMGMGAAHFRPPFLSALEIHAGVMIPTPTATTITAAGAITIRIFTDITLSVTVLRWFMASHIPTDGVRGTVTARHQERFGMSLSRIITIGKRLIGVQTTIGQGRSIKRPTTVHLIKDRTGVPKPSQAILSHIHGGVMP